MKKIKYILIVSMVVSIFSISCLKEDNVANPVINNVQLFVVDEDGNDLPITTVKRGQEIKIFVSTDADMVAVWPGGIRQTMKKKNSSQDSLDMYGHPVLEVSDNYEDYGLVKARGLNTTLGDAGWYVFYVYPTAGEFDLTIVATNHGYDGPDLKKIVYDAGTVKVME